MRIAKRFVYGLVLIIGSPVVLWLAWKCWSVFITLNPNVAAAIVTAIAGVIGLSLTQYFSKKRDIEEGHRKHKTEVYNLFLDIVEEFQSAERTGKNTSDKNGKLNKNIQKKFADLNRGLILWASPKVIKAWLKFKENTDEENVDKFTLFYVDEMLQEIRKDLGNSNFGLKNGDIVKQYLSNPEEIDELRKEYKG